MDRNNQTSNTKKAIIIEKVVKQEMRKTLKSLKIKKLNVIINLKAVQGILYIRTVLYKYQVCREMFIEDIERGIVAHIPFCLSQD